MNSECLLPLSNFLEMISFWIAYSVMGKLSHYSLENPEFTSQLLRVSVFTLRWCLGIRYRVTIFGSHKSPVMCIHLVSSYLGFTSENSFIFPLWRWGYTHMADWIWCAGLLNIGCCWIFCKSISTVYFSNHSMHKEMMYACIEVLVWYLLMCIIFRLYASIKINVLKNHIKQYL